MKRLLFLALSILSLSAIARPPLLWEGDNAWLLRDNLKFHTGDTKIMKGNLDPSAVAVSASAGSMYIASSGKWYKKSDSGSTTNWTEIGGAVAETDPVYSGDPAFSITAPQIASWDIAYGWGNHALAGYLTVPKFLDTGADHSVTIVSGENNTADRNLTLDVGDAARSLRLWQGLFTGGSLAAESTNFVLSNEATAGDSLAVGGNNNTLIGIGAGTALTTGDGSTCIGNTTCTGITTQLGYTAVGDHALQRVTGESNTAVGYRAGGSEYSDYANVKYNVSIGSETMGDTRAGTQHNTMVGHQAMSYAGTDTLGNVGVGSKILTALNGGDYNIAIGYDSGDVLETGDNNIYIGNNIDAAAAGEADMLRIGNDTTPAFIVGNMAASGDLVFSPSGEVGIGITNPTRKLEVVGDISATGTVNRDAENYGQMAIYKNSSPTAIDIVDAWHPFRLFSSCSVINGVTFDAGSAGVVASVATYDSGAKIQVTDTAHGLLDGEVVCFVNSTDYDACYLVESKTDNTFVVAVAYNADRTFNWYQPSTLKVAKAGIYRISYNTSADSGTSNKAFVIQPFQNTSKLDCLACSKFYATGTDYGQCSGSGVWQFAAGDVFWLGVQGITDATDITLYMSNVNMQWIGNAP